MKKRIPWFIFMFLMTALLIPSSSISVKASIPSGLTDGHTYWIVNSHSTKVLDVANAATSNNTNVLQWRNTNANNQKWILNLSESGNYCTLRPAHAPTKYLSVASNSPSNGTNVCISTFSDKAKWKITQLSNGNYKIASALNTSMVLTTNQGSIVDGANEITYSYSPGNSCNDEWFFSSPSGNASKSVTLAVQKDSSFVYRFSDDPTEDYRIIADVSKPFYRSFHVEIIPSFSNIGNLILNSCPNGYMNECTTANCGSVCKNRIQGPNHHKNFDYNALNAWQQIGKGNNSIRIILVGADLCHDTDTGHNTDALGWWPDGVNGMAEQNRGHMLDVRVVQHELSHTFGTSHCNSTRQPCIMNSGFDNNYTYNLYSIWCNSCKNDFDRNRY